MRILLALTATCCILAQIAAATTYTVSVNGGAQFTSINAGISAASGITHDTVKVLPGVYNEKVILNKDITLLGSGFENTVILSATDSAIMMSAGKLQWFRVTSTGGNGIVITGGTVKNVVVISCALSGLYNPSGTAYADNCIFVYNGSYGVLATSPGLLYVTNCISRWNTGCGYEGQQYNNRVVVSYSNGSLCHTQGNVGCIDQDPQFVLAPYDLHLQPSSPCVNTGDPSLYDPDGSRSDMGYFGGPVCPVFPIVSDMTMQIVGGNVQVTVTGKANY